MNANALSANASSPAARGLSRLAVAACVAATLTGCAVTPQPVTRAEREATLQQDLALLYKDQEPLQGKLSLEEAMARAVKYNLEYRLRMMEEAVGARQVDIARMDMLPRLTASAGYSWRNNDLVTDSVDVDTRKPTLSNSTSQDRNHGNADLVMVWNVLDFGVSYFQAHQQADRALILAERRRKTIHNLMQQVRQAYWQAVGAQALEQQVAPLLEQVNRALADTDIAAREKLRAPLDLLNYRKGLLDLVRQLEAIRDELGQAKPRLASLINLPLDSTLELEAPDTLAVPSLTAAVPQLERRALLQRPELLEVDLQERIGVNEVKKAMARMMPGLEFAFGPHYDSNSFLHNNTWIEGGMRVSWNLFNLVSGPRQKALAQQQVDVARIQRLALNMAILTQVHVAVRDYDGRKRQYELAQQLFDIDHQINAQTTAGVENNAQSRLNAIRSGASELMANYRRYQNYAGLQSAYAQVMASVGDDPLPDAVPAHDIGALTSAIRAQQAKGVAP